MQTLAIFVAGLMVGNEFCVSAFVHPQLRSLNDRAHAAAAKAIARAFGAVMPFWYAGTLLLTGAVAFSLQQSGPAPFRLEALPGDWKQMRLTWDARHVLRVVILAVAFVCLIAACLTSRTLTK